MDPLAAPHRLPPPPAYFHETAARELLDRGLPLSDVLEVAMTPRTPRAATPRSGPGSKPSTPRPVIRGSRAQMATYKDLTPHEEKAVVAAFHKLDTHKSGKLEVHSFFQLCQSLDIHLNSRLAREWLGSLNQVDGLSLDQVKSICARILAAQTPAVRACAAGRALALSDLQASEEYMRSAFRRFAPKGTVSPDGLRQLLKALDFPDVHSDAFDRYVSEWLLIAGKSQEEETSISVHDFISCVNLLVDLCQVHQLEQEQKDGL
eukprot:CAMPEP_0181483888 /NCGR_PEP_ID=MMETSP1110-20121109/45677_1 /TAXON_ID=174948 /ORGANISM="Symbiodinium sp., Strain CCMP421" /LENGTH=261 /DNA_ID=CAMNT_0023609661 /DNA_START=32 /DNA_END=817 /DNA_ORIENTATION=+